MMKQRLLSLIFVIILLFVRVPQAKAEHESLYHYYLQQGIEALYKKQYQDAYFSFKVAHAIDPQREQAVRYLNLLKREQEGRLENIIPVNIEKNPITTSNVMLPKEVQAKLLDAVVWQATRKLLFENTPQNINEFDIAAEVDHAVDDYKAEAAGRIPQEIFLDIKQKAPGEVAKNINDYRNGKEDVLAPRAESVSAQQNIKKSESNTKIPEPYIQKLNDKKNVQLSQDKNDLPSSPVKGEPAVQLTKNQTDQTPPDYSRRSELTPHEVDERIDSAFAKAIEEGKKQAAVEAASNTPKSVVPHDEVKNIKLNPPNAPLQRQVYRPTNFNTVGSPKDFGNVLHYTERDEIKLDDQLWKLQPNTTIEIEVGHKVLMTGKNLTRYLVITPNLIEVTRGNANQIYIKALIRGTTILHVWDDHGRWTFNIRCVYPFDLQSYATKTLKHESAKPFRMKYSSGWSSSHSGSDFGSMTRKTLIFTNLGSIEGETPYGQMDAWAQTNMFANSTEVVGQGVGLTNGQIGPFKEFTIRGYDTAKSLSPLTLPGRYFRGVRLDSYAFRHKIAYSYFYGQDQSISIFSSSDNGPQHLQSYLEGYKITLYPDLPSNYSFNYVRGYGSARPAGYKNEVYSVETTQKFHEHKMNAELASDHDAFAFQAQSSKKYEKLKYNINFRNIEKTYQTIFGEPAGAGQIGSQLNLDWKEDNYQLSSYLDLYHDNQLSNPDHPGGLNVDLNLGLGRDLSSSSSVSTSITYRNTPQLLSPQQSFQIANIYSKYFKIADSRYLSTSLVQAYQWARNKNSPSADFDRLSLGAGFRLNLFRNLSYFMNLDYIWVRDILLNDWSNPKAFTTGLSYTKPITDRLSLNYDLNYRKESQSTSSFSFLAGEDSIANAVSLTYNPAQDVQIYMDTQLRRVWPQASSRQPYSDMNLSVGMRAGWDLPFRWDSTGIIKGVIYKDLNGNGLQDRDEPGIPNIKVLAGRYDTITNDNGEYQISVKAKKVNVSLDFKTIPAGFVFSTVLSRDVVIQHGKSVSVNFGLTSRSGIYGIVYVDLNKDGKPNQGDKFISSVIVRLDDSEITKSDGSGSYFFENIKPGKHRIRFDVNSIPIQYVPTVKVQQDIDLKEGLTYVYNLPLKENPLNKQP